MSNPDLYTVGWICAISTEFVAARAFLDEEHEGPTHVAQRDNNTYTLGRIGKHNIVIAVLPDGDYGTASAASVARDMLHSFPNIRIGLMVGIGGGAPTVKHDVRLGDIVVSASRDGHGGVFQYDFGKTIQSQEFHATRFLDQPPTILRTAVSGLKAQYEADGHQIQEAVQAALTKKPRLRRKYNQPDPSTDRLYRADIVHALEAEVDCLMSCGSDASLLVARRARDEDEDDLIIHYGLIASANQLMKDAVIRDKLAQEKDVLCFEMEAAGLMNHFPCLVIRGICDYSDTHKNKVWQGYAAMVAAAYAKDVLHRIPPNKVEAEKKLNEMLGEMHMDVSQIRGQTSATMAHVESLRADGRSEKVRNWLAPPDPSTNFNKAREQHHEGTGQWLLDSEVYTKWKTEQNSFLWLSGIPGCGKTILSSSIIADLEQSVESDRILLYFFFDFNDVDKQSLDKAVRSLIDQLCFQRKSARKATDALFSACGDGLRQPDQRSLLALLRNMLQSLPDRDIWIVLDALDECHKRNEITAFGFIPYIKSLRDCTAKVHLLVTSRPEYDLRSAIENWARDSEVIPLQSTRVESDIDSYIKAKIRQLSRWQNRPDIQNEIESVLSGKADGMFRWVSCQFDILRECLDPRAVRRELANLPRTLDQTYERILQNVISTHQDSATRLLQLLTYSDRPLRLVEAVDAIAVDLSNEINFDPKDRMPCPEEIVGYCSSLAVLVRRKDQKDKTEVVEIQLAHFSVREYLISSRLRGEVASDLSRSNASTALSKVCLSYLLSLDPSHQPHVAIDNYPLAQYAAQYWPTFAAIAEQSAKSALPLIGEYFSSIPMMNFCYRLYNPDRPGEENMYRPEEEISLNCLYFASLSGLTYSAQGLIDEGADVNARGGKYGRALQAASAKGHSAIVRILLDQGADVDAKGGHYGSALQAASWEGDHETVQLLLKAGANANVRGGTHDNSLHAASLAGHNQVVHLLLQAKADVNAQGGLYENPLQAASWGGHEMVVRLLLEAKADDNSQGGRYGKALHAASEKGNIEVVRILIEAGAYVNAQDGHYGNALQAASCRGHKEVVQLLLEAGANINAQGGWYGNALPAAAWNGHNGIVQLLLEANADINARGNFHGNALYAASHIGDKDLVRLLLKAKADVNAQGGRFNNPLRVASLAGHTEVVQLLLEAKADVNAQGGECGNALQAASSRGHKAVVKLLTEAMARTPAYQE